MMEQPGGPARDIKCEGGEEEEGCTAGLPGLLTPAAALSSVTPRTPEILNSLIAMTSPLDQYPSYSELHLSVHHLQSGCGDSSSSSSSIASPGPHTPHSIQKTCSELIKAGLKLSIESKRKMSGSECSESGGKRCKKEATASDEDYDSGTTHNYTGEGLTPEDEERRRRRRERNKIAATKCRLKKRERTVNLVTESEILETQNIDLKSQLQELETQRRQLLDMLSVHTASCRRAPAYPPPAPHSHPEYDYAAAYEPEPPSPYLRADSADLLASAYPAAPTPTPHPHYYELHPAQPRCQEFSEKPPVSLDNGCLA